MGIDIYLGGWDEYEKRIAPFKKKFDDAVAKRDKFERGSAAAECEQKEVSKWSDKMWSGSVGYIRSSYNSSGLFPKLEEIFGVDCAAFLFGGNWDNADGYVMDSPTPTEFVERVNALIKAAGKLDEGTPLPLIPEDVKLPDPHAKRASGEQFGAMVRALLVQAMPDADRIEGGFHNPEAVFNSGIHNWYVTEGLKDLYDFGMLAVELERKAGKPPRVYVSY